MPRVFTDHAWFQPREEQIAFCDRIRRNPWDASRRPLLFCRTLSEKTSLSWCKSMGETAWLINKVSQLIYCDCPAKQTLKNGILQTVMHWLCVCTNSVLLLFQECNFLNWNAGKGKCLVVLCQCQDDWRQLILRRCKKPGLENIPSTQEEITLSPYQYSCFKRAELLFSSWCLCHL